MIRSFSRPRIVLSQCLELEPCRYDGQSIRARIVPMIQPFVDLVPVCPEVEIGLGVPRPPIRLVSLEPAAPVRLVQPATGRDVTEPMRSFSASWLDGVRDIDGFLLKARSPSCGIKDVRIYAEAGAPSGKGPGIFAAAVLERFPDAAVEDEGRLTSYRLRHHFLLRIFAFARLRQVAESGSMAELGRFHAEYKLMLMAHSETGMRSLGRLVANADGRPFEELVALYRTGFSSALQRPARPGPSVNALMHAQGYASPGLTAGEKRHFAELIDGYRARRLPLSALLAVVQGWIARFDLGYLAAQRFFEPYPRELLDLRDSAGDSIDE
jgi:uncharacterized protein YbgA (DUF1722 family)/uncharacterized protein YbbK (DUF523 family)